MIRDTRPPRARLTPNGTNGVLHLWTVARDALVRTRSSLGGSRRRGLSSILPKGGH